MRTLVYVFLLNLVMSLDNVVVIAGIVCRSQHVVGIALASALMLTTVRAGLSAGLHQFPPLPGVQLALGVMVLGIAWRMTRITEAREEGGPPWWKLLPAVVLADLALSLDNIMVLSLVSQDVWTIAPGTALSLLTLLAFLPVIARIMQQVPWLQIVASGFVALLGVRAMLQDSLIGDRLLAMFPVVSAKRDLPAAVALLFILYGIGTMVNKRRGGGFG